MNTKEIEIILQNSTDQKLIEQIEIFSQDSRKSVQNLCNRYRRKMEKDKLEILEWQNKLEFDLTFHNDNKILVGIDEVGRGPLAGPVVAAAVILPYASDIVGLKDSKKLTEEKREMLYEKIYDQAEAVGVGIVDAEIIDEINILQATFLAMRHAIDQLQIKADVIIVDGDKCIPHIECTQHTVVKGDDKSAAIAAASVIAKVTRDRMMREYAQQHEGYDWENNKGYGSQKHYDAIKVNGLTPLHRRSFLKTFLKTEV
ncbi:MAG: ribonuclease HII [Cellulosilyticaceae bacterium]